jgi:hypothetical protein
MDFLLFFFIPGSDRRRLQCHAAYRAISGMILLNLGMHWAGVDNVVPLEEGRIAFQRHAAARATARRVALHAFTHRTEVFRYWLALLRDFDIGDLMVIMPAATGMSG